jgi:hypothetical protein
MKLTKVLIYFWEGYGECTLATSKFRLEMDIGNERRYAIGSSSYLRKILKQLESRYKVKLPKISWKAIVGNEEDGGTLYKWTSKGQK